MYDKLDKTSRYYFIVVVNVIGATTITTTPPFAFLPATSFPILLLAKSTRPCLILLLPTTTTTATTFKYKIINNDTMGTTMTTTIKWQSPKRHLSRDAVFVNRRLLHCDALVQGLLGTPGASRFAAPHETCMNCWQ